MVVKFNLNPKVNNEWQVTLVNTNTPIFKQILCALGCLSFLGFTVLALYVCFMFKLMFMIFLIISLYLTTVNISKEHSRVLFMCVLYPPWFVILYFDWIQTYDSSFRTGSFSGGLFFKLISILFTASEYCVIYFVQLKWESKHCHTFNNSIPL